MKKLFLIVFVLLGVSQASAMSCKPGQSYQCLAAQPPALGMFCGCAANNISSIHIIPSKSVEPWNSCLACD